MGVQFALQGPVAGLLCTGIQIFVVLVFLRVVLSWFPPTGGAFDSVQQLVFKATEWAFAPLRRVLPPVRLGAAALDLSPIVLLVGLSVLRGFICG
jgi:YggT family protein